MEVNTLCMDSSSGLCVHGAFLQIQSTLLKCNKNECAFILAGLKVKWFNTIAETLYEILDFQL